MQVNDEATCDTWYQALLERAPDYAGIFFVGVRTTGVFCIATCRARKPRRENVQFYSTMRSAQEAGFRPCKVCRPTENAASPPQEVEKALALLRHHAGMKISDRVLREHQISPEALRRWFRKHQGMTFQAYQRMQRVNDALLSLKSGRTATETAFDSGYDSLSGFGYTFKKLTGAAPTGVVSVILMQRFTTPLGPMVVCATDKGVCLLEFTDRKMLKREIDALQRVYQARILAGENAHTQQAIKEIEAYFCGTRTHFTVPLDIPGTPFQQAVWQALRQVGYGETAHYALLAAKTGRPDAVRAVASATGANRIAIIIPCHRISGKAGGLTGYGGGIARKKWLLEHEEALTSSAAVKVPLPLPGQ
ncbi:methylated-DNA--[protein]-cysteine S-methyltransferase [Yokenella regensburgei]|uniref:bifunctional transcriptional activator/DNA repair enzyme AdaA n=1 Tax=Yokenella regensburgei TaxID=158877 RepID=UPI003F17DFDE